MLNHDYSSLWAHRAITFEQGAHIDAVDDRHDQIQPAVDFTGVVDGNDVRFGKPSGRVGFAAKALSKPGFSR
ncbi:hypothetical protein A5760_19680 [Mycobacterium colombiense]|uniref:Uncharacterized protein n=1 Tax=Mycobacterium colombiense TaxID=339268 RepID=A0A1A0VAR0_9MYCO|nr:hypothetical protein A5760_19680 [Mycobacterium colombiense]